MNNYHHTRTHAAWAASATARNTTCAGAMAMATLAGPEVESGTAAWGTATHQLAQKCFELDTSGDRVSRADRED